MKIYVVTVWETGSQPYPVEAFKDEGEAWDSIRGKSNEIRQYDVHEVVLQ